MARVDNIIRVITNTILIPLAVLMIAIAVVVFLYGVVEFIAGADNQEKREKGKRHIIWSIIGLFIMISAIGILNLLASFWR
jgi:uncharacterized membrane protein YidH (DUF202 family)